MTRELVFLHVGQCGNQIGGRFWDVALQDIANKTPDHNIGEPPRFDRNLNVLFRNVDDRNGFPLPLGAKVSSLKARAVLIDMETGVINPLLRSPIGELFTKPQVVTDVSGSGNNWATGYMVYGPQYHERIIDAIRLQLECCDCCDSLLSFQSLSGGTGSGLGSYVIEKMADEFPEINRVVVPVVPATTENVVTAPYNAVLSLCSLRDHADVVLPIDNDSLLNHQGCSNYLTRHRALQRQNPFDPANNIVAAMTSLLVASMCSGGDSPIFPSHLKLMTTTANKCLSSVLYETKQTGVRTQTPDWSKVFKHSNRFKLIRSWRGGTDSSTGIIYRGDENLASLLGTIPRLSLTQVDLINSIEAIDPQIHQILRIANCPSIYELFSDVLRGFTTLFKRKAHLHHYLEYMEESKIRESAFSLSANRTGSD